MNKLLTDAQRRLRIRALCKRIKEKRRKVVIEVCNGVADVISCPTDVDVKIYDLDNA
jgi:hypothetical protein